MPANVYECMFLLDTNKVAGNVAEAQAQLHIILERHHCEMLASRPWDERKLAYPIKKGGVSHKKGLYYLTYFRTEGQNIAALEKDFALVELVLRMLVQAIEPKLVDAMLAVARDERAVALQTVNDPVDDDILGGGGGGRDRDRDRDRGPRDRDDRGPRHRAEGGEGGEEEGGRPPRRPAEAGTGSAPAPAGDRGRG